MFFKVCYMDRLEPFFSKQQGKFPKTLTRRELAYERIRDAIRATEISPGESLTETRLSKLLGISRTPIREALQQLVQEGLAETSPGQAVTVTAPTLQDVLDVVHIRSLLEPEQVRLATEVMTAKQLETLEAAMKDMERAVKQGELTQAEMTQSEMTQSEMTMWANADSVYHTILKEACPNKLLAETVVQLKNRVHSMANFDTQINLERLLSCTKEHRAVIEAIKGRNSKAAKAAMEEHLAALTNSLLKRISYR
jgi:DNA-binding GntR family transcriptional regulator